MKDILLNKEEQEIEKNATEFIKAAVKTQKRLEKNLKKLTKKTDYRAIEQINS